MLKLGMEGSYLQVSDCPVCLSDCLSVRLFVRPSVCLTQPLHPALCMHSTPSFDLPAKAPRRRDRDTHRRPAAGRSVVSRHLLAPPSASSGPANSQGSGALVAAAGGKSAGGRVWLHGHWEEQTAVEDSATEGGSSMRSESVVCSNQYSSEVRGSEEASERSGGMSCKDPAAAEEEVEAGDEAPQTLFAAAVAAAAVASSKHAAVAVAAPAGSGIA